MLPKVMNVLHSATRYQSASCLRTFCFTTKLFLSSWTNFAYLGHHFTKWVMWKILFTIRWFHFYIKSLIFRLMNYKIFVFSCDEASPSVVGAWMRVFRSCRLFNRWINTYGVGLFEDESTTVSRIVCRFVFVAQPL